MTRKNSRIEFTVYGVPVAQPRPKVTVRGGHPHAYVPKSHAVHSWRGLVQDKADSLKWEMVKKPTPIRLELLFWLPRPKSNKNDNHIVRPDVDNFAKAVMDALEGIAYENDSQVNVLVAIKDYGDHPGVEIEIIREG